MGTNKQKKVLSIIALILILAIILGTVASALMGCGAVEQTAEASEQTQAPQAAAELSDTAIRVGALKGATTIGLVNLVDKTGNTETDHNYDFGMYTAASDVMAAMVSGDLDIALVPANVACVMNTKVEGGVSVIDINTLGVLNCVSADDKITSIADLSGRTVYTTGQGSVPEYTIRYLLEAGGVTDCNLEFKSEPTEIVSLFLDDESAIAILPQPFATAALAQNEALKISFDLSDEWDKTVSDCKIVTGVTVASNKFIAEHPDLVEDFLKEHKESADKALSDVDTTAALVVEQGIIAKEPLAKKAIPNCSIVFITGQEMKDTLEGFLKILYEQDPKSVGGSLPGDEFYYGV